MSDVKSLGELIETDILVIGCGVSGLWAANKAKEYVDSVTIVDKGPADLGGLASLAGGDYVAALPEEHIENFVQDLVYYYDGLCDQVLVEEIFKESFNRLKDYQRMGCEFLTDANGKLKGIPQRSLDHVKLYPAKLRGRGGANMISGLIKEAKRLGVNSLGRIQISDLIKNNNRIVGAVGFDMINGKFYIFKTNSIILATGQGGWKIDTDNSTGEGIYMAFRAGALLRNAEFARVWNKPKLFRWEGQTTLLPLGAKFVNAQDESFMEKYSPKFGPNTDPHYTVRGMAVEAREGRGPFYMDTSGLKPEDIYLVEPQNGWQKLNYDKLKSLGIDFFRDRTEWLPELRHTYLGVIADAKGQTQVPALFAVGRAQSIDPSVYMGGFALCVTAVTGHITGETAARYVKSNKPLQIDVDEVKRLKNHLYIPFGKAGIRPHEILRFIQQVVSPYDVCILKNETSLKKALNIIINIKNELLPHMGAEDPHYLGTLREVEAITFVTESFLRASLMRKESRAGHYREDFPLRDDKHWLKWIVINKNNNGVNLYTEPVPIHQYKYKPTKYYMDNFTFPMKEISK